MGGYLWQVKTIVLLDIDGTLVDSNQLHADSWHAALARHGIACDLATLRGMIGMGADKLLEQAVGIQKDSQLGARIVDTRSELFMRDYLPRVQPFPGARALVQRILDSGLTPVVASSASSQELEGLLERAQVDDLLPRRTGADDAGRSKPDPDILHAALEMAHARPEDATLIGDTPYDMEAAQRAGVAFVGVRSGGYDDAQLPGAVAVYSDVAALLADFDRFVQSAQTE
jgi:HAD superfamily hydrolase (TIGR01509 family)